MIDTSQTNWQSRCERTEILTGDRADDSRIRNICQRLTAEQLTKVAGATEGGERDWQIKERERERKSPPLHPSGEGTAPRWSRIRWGVRGWRRATGHLHRCPAGPAESQRRNLKHRTMGIPFYQYRVCCQYSYHWMWCVCAHLLV